MGDRLPASAAMMQLSLAFGDELGLRDRSGSGLNWQ